MNDPFNDKVVWITGASSGIGEALAYEMSAAGAKLMLSSRRMKELERVKQACADPAKVMLLHLDLADAASLEGKVAEALKCFGHIDIMVHNGGVTQRSLVVDTPIEEHRHLMELDYFSYIIITKALLPHFVERQAGHFVVTSSVMGKLGTPMRAGYAAAKHALHGYFDCLRAEVAGDNIKVTLLTPGYIKTNITGYSSTTKPKGPAKPSENIDNGLSAGKAAKQIMKAIKNEVFEAYIGKMSSERLGLWFARFLPGVLKRLSPK